VPEDGGLIGQALIGLKPMNAWVHTYTKPQTSSTRSRGLAWQMHESVEDTKLSTNKQHSLCTLFIQIQPWDKRNSRLPFSVVALIKRSDVNGLESCTHGTAPSSVGEVSTAHIHA